MKINKYAKTTLLISLGLAIESFAAVVKMDTSVNTKATSKSSKVYVDEKNIGYFRKGEKIQVVKVIKNKEGTWYKTPRGYVKKKYLRYNPKTENLSNYIKVVPKYKMTKNKVLKVEKELLLKPLKKEVRVDFVKKELLKRIEKTKDRKYFIGFEINQNKLNIEQNDQIGSIILSNSLDKNATSFNFQIGKKFDNYLLSTNYERLNSFDAKIDSYYVSLDYQFNHKLRPFIGISLGKNDLTWKVDPLANSQTKDKKISSFMYGIQAGLNYPIDKKWSIYSKLSYQKFNLKTKLISIPAKSEIIYKNRSSLGLGIRYFFNLD